MRLGLGISLSGTPGGAASSFDPATLALTGWWRASYAGSPWTGTASAGTSGSRNLTEATNPPAVGAAINGLTPADLDGANDRLLNATLMTTMVSASAGTLVALFNADAAAADGGATSAYTLPLLIGEDASGALYLAYSSSGVRFGGVSAAPAHNSVAVAASPGSLHFAVATWNATTMSLSVDGGAFSSVAHVLTLGGGSVSVGKNYDGTAFFNGQLAEIMMGAFTATAGDVANLKSYINARYARSF